MGKKKLRYLAVGATLVLTGLFSMMSFYGISVGVNLTRSQPYCLFLILRGRPFGRGDLVAFRFPGSRYYGEGTLFAKEVRGWPGDRLEIREDRAVWLNGEFLDTVRATDSKGRPVEPFYFRGMIPDGSYFLYAAAPNSYDSRYYGLAERNRIMGRVVPLF